jgi:hypothetical protein
VVPAVAVVLVATVVIGGLTSPGQKYLPDALRPLANAVGPWFITVLVAVRAGRSRVALSVVLAILGFVLLNVSYGIVSQWRGYAYSAGPTNIWNILAVPAGVVAGLAAAWLRSPRALLVAIGAAAPAGILIGEGVYGLTAVLDTTGPVVWILEIICAVAFVTWMCVRRLRTARLVCLCIALSVAGAALFDVGVRLI